MAISSDSIYFPDSSSIYVALDIESTGPNPERDEIIEIAAVRFRGSEVLEEFDSLVNPYRPLNDFIQRFTGISDRDVESAPPLAAVADNFLEVVSSYPVVGHGIRNDLAFLLQRGIEFKGPALDTLDLASFLLPDASQYSLVGLARELGLAHPRPHRALHDAQVTRQLFTVLLSRLLDLDESMLRQMEKWSSRSGWSLGPLFRGILSELSIDSWYQGDLSGINWTQLEQRLRSEEGVVSPVESHENAISDLGDLLEPGGVIEEYLPEYEYRPQQVEMMRKVDAALANGEHLIVEGGTGIGKSLAYLLPAILFAYQRGERILVSTNTINLQAQLLNKDIPAIVEALGQGGYINKDHFRAVELKGRANYLCLRRWSVLASTNALSPIEARFASKILVWLQQTMIGDRSELNLPRREDPLWSRVSAGEAGYCPAMAEGRCFLRAARERAERAQLVVVNHALLLSDLARGGGLPSYDHVIIDEAHHLEEQATNQWSHQVSATALLEHLDVLEGILETLRIISRSMFLESPQKDQLTYYIAEVNGRFEEARVTWAKLWSVLEGFLHQHRDGSENSGAIQIWITDNMRRQPDWSAVEVAWEEWSSSMDAGWKKLEDLHNYLSEFPDNVLPNKVDLLLDLVISQEWVEDLQRQLRGVAVPQEETVHWVDQDSRRGTSTWNAAPLEIAGLLKQRLFSRKKSVILTGATLSTQGQFGHLRERIGLEQSAELLVGSPFDYKKAALVLLPTDTPEPDAPGFKKMLEEGLLGLARALRGHTLVLFTSHAALRGAYNLIRKPLGSEGIRVMGQGLDGTPQQLIKSFQDNPRSVLMGTNSFWEGVDMPGGILKALVLVRLPFNVPTDPIFAARSRRYEEPFMEYAVPQAVLRFRQGFGRLVRRKEDRGIVLVLDGRILSRPYGSVFLDSIPPCDIRRGPLNNLIGEAVEWL